MNPYKKKGRKPINEYLAQECYVLVDEVQRKAKHNGEKISEREAIYRFLEGPKFANLVKRFQQFYDAILDNHISKLRDYQDPSMHDLDEMREYMKETEVEYVEPETGEFFTKEMVELIKEKLDDLATQVGRIPSPREPDKHGHNNTGYSERAYKCIKRCIEAHELAIVRESSRR